jgi:hypothetical protein
MNKGEISKYMAEMGRRGGQAAARKLTKKTANRAGEESSSRPRSEKRQERKEQNGAIQVERGKTLILRWRETVQAGDG